MPNAAQRTASTSDNVSPIAMSLFQRSIAQARSAAVLDSDGSTSGSSVMEEVLVSDAQTFASMNLCESEDHIYGRGNFL
jgi:hypothetical protein